MVVKVTDVTMLQDLILMGVAANMTVLTAMPVFDFDCIVTNPPFSLKNEFIEKCYEYKKPFALLLPITALEGEKRGKMYKEHGLELIVLDKRVNYVKNHNTNWFNTSWFCHGLLSKELNFEIIKKH